MNKKTIEIPVSSFTGRILEARYGAPIPTSRQRNKELYNLLQVNPIQAPNPQRKKLLDQSVFFIGSSQLAQAIRQRDRGAIGIFLHEHFIREMYLHTHSQVIAGREAWTALEDFYAMHGLEEEDWKFDTAYRNWLRYSDQVERRKGSEKSVNIRPSQNVRSTVYLLLAELDNFQISPDLVAITLQELSLPFRDSRLIQAFLLSQLCHLPPSLIARRMGYTRQNASQRLQAMDHRLEDQTPTITRLIRTLSRIRSRVLS